MIISYETDKYIKEQHQMEIQDTKNVFLQGRCRYSRLVSYFGIWSNNNYLVIVTLRNNNCINYTFYSKDQNPCTETYIRQYLEENVNVDFISKDIFKEQLQKISLVLEI